MQTPYALDLRDLMDSHYGVGCWTERSAVGAGSDIGPAMAAGVVTLRASFGRGIIRIPPGNWLMNTSPGDVSGIYFEGAGSMASKIIFNNAKGTAFNFTGLGGFTGGGIRHLGIMLESGFGNTSSYGILMRGDATFQPDQTNFHDIYMSSIGASSFWWDGFHADGSARSTPQGIRICHISMVEIFDCCNLGFYGANLVGWSMINLGVFVGANASGNTVEITGGSTDVFAALVDSAGLSVTGVGPNVTVNGTKYS